MNFNKESNIETDKAGPKLKKINIVDFPETEILFGDD